MDAAVAKRSGKEWTAKLLDSTATRQTILPLCVRTVVPATRKATASVRKDSKGNSAIKRFSLVNQLETATITAIAMKANVNAMNITSENNVTIKNSTATTIVGKIPAVVKANANRIPANAPVTRVTSAKIAKCQKIL